MVENKWSNEFKMELVDHNRKKFGWIKEKMDKSIVSHNNVTIGGYEIVELFHVKNPVLWNKYRDRRKEMSTDMGGVHVLEPRLFHGTQLTEAEEIARNGFQVELAKTSGMFGKAIYFAEHSSKSNQYTFEGCWQPCKLHRDIQCDVCIRTMLICRVALGKVYYAKEAMNGLLAPPDGHHCVAGDPDHCKGLRYKEFAIFNNFQAYPGHIVKYRIKRPGQINDAPTGLPVIN